MLLLETFHYFIFYHFLWFFIPKSWLPTRVGNLQSNPKLRAGLTVLNQKWPFSNRTPDFGTSVSSAEPPAVFPAPFLTRGLGRCSHDCDVYCLHGMFVEEDRVPWGGKCSLTVRWSPVCCSRAHRPWPSFVLEGHSTPSLRSCTSGSSCCQIQGLGWGDNSRFYSICKHSLTNRNHDKVTKRRL